MAVQLFYTVLLALVLLYYTARLVLYQVGSNMTIWCNNGFDPFHHKIVATPPDESTAVNLRAVIEGRRTIACGC